MTAVSLAMAPGPLLEALAWTLRAGGFTLYWLGDGGDLPNLILTTPRDWSAPTCGAWSLRGPQVVVLAPIPFRREREAYVAAGALYRPMGGRAEELLNELRALASRTPVDPSAFGPGVALPRGQLLSGRGTHRVPRDGR